MQKKQKAHRKVSITDIARKAGVSIATVSYVMNGVASKNRISEESAKRIKEIAKQLKYQPNYIAKSLKDGSTKTIGLVVADISNTFFGDMAKAIEEEASRYSYTVLFGSSNEDFNMSNKLVNTLINRQVDGMILSPVEGDEDKIMELSDEVPLICVDRYIRNENISYVILDNFAATYDAVDHLLRSGFKRIAIVGYDSEMIHIQERFRGYRAAMGTFIPNAQIHEAKIRYQHIEEDIAKALHDLIIRDGAIDAIIFATNTLTVAGLYFFQKNNIKVPNDIAVIGFDGNVAFDFFYSPITYIKQPVYEMGKQAVKILMDQINGKEESGQVMLKHQLIVRESTK